eukprot:CAMPEP_0174761934 /NCGR_PEP_ID=MMETSP1094-20130205/109523_1 /TAXON_ID=156173 /ORGANISM="Chrysochromulina brevifilum, Strain UTEX LB 985" /LENGTH=272 /DNA_ID=CAMNT_0015967881 /DNA_START=4 /DNA_END=820 /DNA_ORIENTATION=-
MTKLEAEGDSLWFQGQDYRVRMLSDQRMMITHLTDRAARRRAAQRVMNDPFAPPGRPLVLTPRHEEMSLDTPLRIPPPSHIPHWSNGRAHTVYTITANAQLPSNSPRPDVQPHPGGHHTSGGRPTTTTTTTTTTKPIATSTAKPPTSAPSTSHRPATATPSLGTTSALAASRAPATASHSSRPITSPHTSLTVAAPQSSDLAPVKDELPRAMAYGRPNTRDSGARDSGARQVAQIDGVHVITSSMACLAGCMKHITMGIQYSVRGSLKSSFA